MLFGSLILQVAFLLQSFGPFRAERYCRGGVNQWLLWLVWLVWLFGPLDPITLGLNDL